MSPRAKGTSAPMTEAHKAALAEGRAAGRAVKNYLEALEAHRPKRGRKRTPDSINARLAAIDAALADAAPLARVTLIQERMDLSDELRKMAEPAADLTALEAEFVKVAAAYSKSKGLSYAAWREVGVDAAVLKKAGISRAV